MNLVFRLLWTILRARVGPRVDLLGPWRTPFRVWPTDCDVLLHVNNGVYLSMMDLGRVDLMLRSGMFAKLRARGWYPVVAAQTIQYARSLGPFQKFWIETRVLGWDERAFFLEQRFIRPGEVVVATAVVRARFLASPRDGQPRRTLRTQELLELSGHFEPSPALPGWVAAWAESMASMKAEGDARG